MSERFLDAMGAPEPAPPPSEVEVAAKQLFESFRLIWINAGNAMRQAASLSARHGGNNLLAALPPNQAAALASFHYLLTALWQEHSSAEVPLWSPEPKD